MASITNNVYSAMWTRTRMFVCVWTIPFHSMHRAMVLPWRLLPLWYQRQKWVSDGGHWCTLLIPVTPKPTDNLSIRIKRFCFRFHVSLDRNFRLFCSLASSVSLVVLAEAKIPLSHRYNDTKTTDYRPISRPVGGYISFVQSIVCLATISLVLLGLICNQNIPIMSGCNR